jgi:hypothetical protein
MGSAWPDIDLVFATRIGRPVEPRNLVRSLRRICDDHDIRLISVHHVRHAVASLLKTLGVPARDAQIILGHLRLAVTLEIYTDNEAKADAQTRLHDLFDRAPHGPAATEPSYSQARRDSRLRRYSLRPAMFSAVIHGPPWPGVRAHVVFLRGIHLAHRASAVPLSLADMALHPPWPVRAWTRTRNPWP